MGIATNIGQSDREARYELPDNEMSVGSTLGGPRGTCIVKASGAIDRIYSTDCGLNLFGTILLRHFDGRTGMLLAQQKPGKFVILPENQEHLYMLSNDVEVRENIFVLGGSPESMQISTPPAVYLSIELRNTTNETLVIETFGFAQLRGKTDPDLRAEWNSALNCMIATNISAPSQCRIFATSTSPESFETNFDKGMPVLQTSPGKLKNAMSENGDQIGVTRHIHTVNPGEMVSWNYLMTFGAGREDALKNLALAPDYSAGLLQTKQYFQKVLKNAIVMTPNEMINLGVLWAKANMVRVQNQAPTGWCFVNDPTQSRNSVGRDTAWFAFGSDFVRPEFSRESLMAYVNNQEEDGLIVEYYDVRNGKTEDYKLNINDNTPLLVLALWHHFNATGDKSFLESVYPAVRKAIGKILKERDHRGLVWCTATGTSDWGIIGWRNVITDYRISGATTEVNSECYAALLSAQRMAKLLGADDESKSYGESAVELRNSINKHLINPENGLYYLNIGVDETRHKEVTSDRLCTGLPITIYRRESSVDCQSAIFGLLRG
jgi:glycogen debranching enzyme